MEHFKGYEAGVGEIDNDTSFYDSENEDFFSYSTVYTPVAESTRIDSYHGRLSKVKKASSRFISRNKAKMSSAYIDDDDQEVPDVRVVEGCEAGDTNVRARSDASDVKKMAALRPTLSACLPRAHRHHPRASSTMIEEKDDNIHSDQELSEHNTNPSVVTWTIHEDSDLIQLEDSYMHNIDKKLVPVFGFTAKNSYAKYSISSAESLKYEDGRTSVMSSDKSQSKSEPLMNSTRNDFHFVPEPEVDVRVYEEITSMFDDQNHVTPENPLCLAEKVTAKKPTKTKKFSNIFKQNRSKQGDCEENSPTKRKLFSRETLKESQGMGKIRIMKKLKQFGESLRTNDKKHLQPLAIL